MLVGHSTPYCNYLCLSGAFLICFQSMIMHLLMQTSSWTCIALGNICLDSVLVCNVSLCCRLLSKFELSVPLNLLFEGFSRRIYGKSATNGSSISIGSSSRWSSISSEGYRSSIICDCPSWTDLRTKSYGTSIGINSISVGVPRLAIGTQSSLRHRNSVPNKNSAGCYQCNNLCRNHDFTVLLTLNRNWKYIFLKYLALDVKKILMKCYQHASV